MIGGQGFGIRVAHVWSSVDGVNWIRTNTNTAFKPSANQSCEVFDGKMWRIGGVTDDEGRNNEAWSSTDGVNWTRETSTPNFSGRVSHSTTVYDNKIWLMGGFDGEAKNDVWVVAE